LSITENEDKWKKAIFWVFDAPDIPNKPFEERIDYLNNLKAKGELPSFVNVVETVKCDGKEHLKEFLNKVLSKGGEGVVLREPQTHYKAGRSDSLRKYKPFIDTEVKVLENNYPHGFNCQQ
jgi:DNA ligase-1